jgi:hypothetical protein
MFCSHNEVDLMLVVIPDGDIDWVTIICKSCKQRVGGRKDVINLVDEALQKRRAQRKKLGD